MTDAEKRLWQCLRLRHLDGYKFRRQYPVAGYIVDFVCLERKPIIEVNVADSTPINEPPIRRVTGYLMIAVSGLCGSGIIKY